MPKYIFLDTNILSDYTKTEHVNALSAYIRRYDFTIIISSLLLIELYNEGWEGAKDKDEERGLRVVRFLSGEHCVIADPMDTWNSEFAALPEKLKRLPIRLDLDKMPRIPREKALLMFLRRDQVFLDMGLDIAEWATTYSTGKDGWLGDTKRIIENACDQGYLQRDGNDRYTVLERDVFLASLDMRLVDDFAQLPEDEANRLLGNLHQLRAVRITSLGFLYKYIDYDRGAKTADYGSDLGDIYFMSVIPWCAVYTTDKNMLEIAKKSANEAKSMGCKIIGRKDLEIELKRRKGNP